MQQPSMTLDDIVVDVDSISRMLTLRYDPLKKPVREPLVASDFEPRRSTYEGDNNVESKILEIARNDLLKTRDSTKSDRVSVSLSGGVDSQLTLALIRMFLPDVKVSCISAGFGEEDDEVAKAKEVARAYDCDFYELIIDNVLTDLPKLIGIVREPRWNLYHYYTFEYGKRRSSSIIYTGDGGDELFGGYTFRYHKFLSLLPKSAAGWKDRAKLYLSCHERDWVPDQSKMFGSAVRFSWDRIYRLFRPYFENNNGLDPLDQVFLADFNGKLLYDWLPTNIAFAKSLGLRIESIFLTDSMIEFATHLPWQKKYDPKTQCGKMPLRYILMKQKAGNNIKPNASKRGFSFGLGFMWEKNAREIVMTHMNRDAEVVKNGLISSTWLEATARNLQEGSAELNPRYINKMLSILALEIWYRLFVSHTMSSKQKL